MDNLSRSANQSIGTKWCDAALSSGTILGASSLELLGSLDTSASYNNCQLVHFIS